MPSKLVLCLVEFGVVWLVISIAAQRNLGVEPPYSEMVCVDQCLFCPRTE